MKRRILLTLLAAFFLALPGRAAALPATGRLPVGAGNDATATAGMGLTVAAKTTPIVLRDTLKTASQRSQFKQALQLAPSTFVYDDYSSDGKTYASVTHLRFNDSMRNVLKYDFVQKDAFLHKQMRRLYLVTRPFGVTGDLTVRYRQVPKGLAVEYTISDLRIWGRPASDRLIREILKANGAAR